MSARPRLFIALGVSMMLVAFMGYFVFASGSQLLVSVSQLSADKDGAQQKTVQLTGTVVSATADQSPVKFVLRDFSSPKTVTVDYTGSVPDAFKVGRSVIVTGKLSSGGVFEGKPDSLLTKCPSKYSASDSSSGA
jgi:cytochrome c-type biogenesis protein CcmE